MTDVAAVAPALLRSARRDLGLSQEQLAERAGLSTRAVRDLEAGRARCPRRSTVAALGAALELGPVQRAEFARCWPLRTTSAVIASGSPTRPIPFLAFRDRTMSTRVVIGAHRRLLLSSCTSVGEALADGLGHRTVAWNRDAEEDLSVCAVRENHDGVRRRARLERDGAALRVELELERQVRRGDFRILSVELDFSRSHARSGAECTAIHDIVRPGTQLLTQEVAFRGCRPPRRAWLVRPGPGTATTRGRDIPVGDQLQVVVADPAPGLHGVAWSW